MDDKFWSQYPGIKKGIIDDTDKKSEHRLGECIPEIGASIVRCDARYINRFIKDGKVSHVVDAYSDLLKEHYEALDTIRVLKEEVKRKRCFHRECPYDTDLCGDGDII